jgi:hypothetical protein
VAEHALTHFLPFEVDEKVNGLAVQTYTQLLEVSSAKKGSTQVLEQELFLGFLYKAGAQSDWQVLFPALMTNPAVQFASQNPVTESAYVLPVHTSTHFLAVLSAKFPLHLLAHALDW